MDLFSHKERENRNMERGKCQKPWIWSHTWETKKNKKKLRQAQDLEPSSHKVFALYLALGHCCSSCFLLPVVLRWGLITIFFSLSRNLRSGQKLFCSPTGRLELESFHSIIACRQTLSALKFRGARFLANCSVQCISGKPTLAMARGCRNDQCQLRRLSV